MLSFTVAGVLYYAFNKIWPVSIYPAHHADADAATFEIMKATDGYFDDDEVIITGIDVTPMQQEEGVLKDIM